MRYVTESRHKCTLIVYMGTKRKTRNVDSVHIGLSFYSYISRNVFKAFIALNQQLQNKANTILLINQTLGDNII